MNIHIEANAVEGALKLANKERLANKRKWYFLQIRLGEKTVLAKGYGTSWQRIEREGVQYPTGWDLSVKDWKLQLERALVS